MKQERDYVKKHIFGNYQVKIDMDTTAKWYAHSKGWGCECSYCRNFLELANKKELPKHITEMLDELGIEPKKATYVSELFTDEAGIHYQVSYRIAGIIIDRSNSDDCENGNVVRCCHEPYPYGAPDFPSHILT